MGCGRTRVSEAKVKLMSGWCYHNRALRVGCSTTRKDPKYLSQIVGERRVPLDKSEGIVKGIVLLGGA